MELVEKQSLFGGGGGGMGVRDRGEGMKGGGRYGVLGVFGIPAR